jgi:AcrR family transcriptional regulator
MASRTAGRPRAAHLGPERRRPLVLDAALSLFVEHGFAGVSIDMIAEAAGVTRPVIYDCYPDKAELFRALLEREEQRLLGHLLAGIPKDPALDDTERLLTEGFTAFLSAAAAAPDSWRMLFMSDHGSDPRIARRLAQARDQVTDRIGEIAAFTLTRAGVRDVERLAPLVAHLIVGQAEASVRLMLKRPGEWTPEELGALLGRLNGPAETLLAELSAGR